MTKERSDDKVVAFAQEVIEPVLGRELVRWDQPPNPVDLRAFDSPTISIEVKVVTNQDLRQTEKRADRNELVVPSSRLTRHWVLGAQVSPVPDFQRIAAEAEQYLVILERHGAYDPRHWVEPTSEDPDDLAALLDVSRARFALERLLGGGQATSNTHTADMPAGFAITFGWTVTSPTDPDGFAQHLEMWLHSNEASKLRDQLERSDDSERHAFLYPETGAHGLGWPLHRLARKRLPAHRLTLPAVLDAVWIGTRTTLVWRCHRTEGWTDETPREMVVRRLAQDLGPLGMRLTR